MKNGPWINQDEQKPVPEKEVAICVIRKAKQVAQPDGSTRWVLTDESPIDIQQDTFFWQETDIESVK
ncbi:hypothetical protein ACVWYF_004148 [Hymenobacter sp. UYAg731]